MCIRDRANTQSVSFSLEAQQLYQQLADQYTRIVNNGCFGSRARIEEKMDRCKGFLEQWMEALCNKDFVTLLQNKAKYDEYLMGFRLPQFGTWRTIQAEGGDDSIPDGLTKALVGRIQSCLLYTSAKSHMAIGWLIVGYALLNQRQSLSA